LDGLSRPVGGDVPYDFNGTTLTVPQVTLADWGTIENHLIQKKQDEVIRLGAEMASRLAASGAVDFAREEIERSRGEAKAIRSVAFDETMAFVQSVEGAGFVLWLSLEKNYPGKFSISQCESEVARTTLENAEKSRSVMDRVMSVGPEGNSTGPTQEQQEPGKGQTSS